MSGYSQLGNGQCGKCEDEGVFEIDGICAFCPINREVMNGQCRCKGGRI